MRTYPDYGTQGQRAAQPDIDLTELAARLNTGNVYRRRGRVLLIDDFSSLNPWNVTLTGTGAAYVTPLRSYRGSNSLYLKAPVGASAKVDRSLPLFIAGKTMGVEFLFGYDSIAAPPKNTLIFQYGWRDAGGYTVSQVVINFNANTVNFGGAASPQVTDLVLNYANSFLPNWYNCKVIFSGPGYNDFPPRTLRGFLNDTEITGINENMGNLPSGIGQSMTISFELQADSYPGNYLVTDLIVTVDEP